MKRWSDYFKTLLNPSLPCSNNVAENTLHLKKGDEQKGMDELNSHITSSEVWKALSKTKRNKAPGLDEIAFETLRNNTCVEFLVNLFNRCFISGLCPDMWYKGMITPILKNPDKSSLDTSNY